MAQNSSFIESASPKASSIFFRWNWKKQLHGLYSVKKLVVFQHRKTTMPDSNKTTQPPQSLFGEKDILHDIETVQAKWAREQVRRRALMVKVFIIGGLFLLLGLGAVIHRIYRINQMRKYYEEQEQKKFDPIGYRNAKIRIFLYANEDAEAVADILREAVDNKPSEFYVQFRPLEGVDGEEVEKALGKFQPGVTINGKYEFKIKDQNGVEKDVKLLGDPGHFFNLKDLGIIINQVHQQIYGESYLQPVSSLFDKRTQSIPIEGVDVDELVIKENGKIDDHDHEKEEETPDGVIERVPLSPDELIVPKLNVKDKK